MDLFDLFILPVLQVVGPPLRLLDNQNAKT